MRKFIKKCIIKLIEFYKLRNDRFHFLVLKNRYEKIVIKLFSQTFEIIDGPSFYYSEKEIFQNNIYLFSKNRDKKMTIIDCGANTGLSIIYFKRNFPNSKIIAFEADPYVYEICKKNVSPYFGADDILINKALWNSNTELDFMSEGADGGRISNKIENLKTVKVKTELLSKYLDIKIDFLKIDIEGAEYKVLLEVKNKLLNVEKLFIEYHSFPEEDQKLDGILSILRNSGFRYQIQSQYISDQPYLYQPLQLGMDLQLNIFAYRA